MFDTDTRVIVRNLPPARREYEGMKANIRYGLDERMVTDWNNNLVTMKSYRVEFDSSWDYIRVPAVCVYPTGE